MKKLSDSLFLLDLFPIYKQYFVDNLKIVAVNKVQYNEMKWLINYSDHGFNLAIVHARV